VMSSSTSAGSSAVFSFSQRMATRSFTECCFRCFLVALTRK
jgi:hypothetical protein